MSTKRKLGPGDDKEMMSSPDLWSHWPRLPVKRRKAGAVLGYELGVMLDADDRRTSVFLAFLFLTDLEKAKRIDYPTLDALLADGWVVD